jgi:hypothetical protein
MREILRAGATPAAVLTACLLGIMPDARAADPTPTPDQASNVAQAPGQSEHLEGTDKPAPGTGTGVVWGGRLLLTLQSDQTLNRSGGVEPFNNTYAEPEFEGFVNLGKHFAINGLVKMEQVRSVTESSAFRAEGAYVEQLYGIATFKPVELYGGKIHPRFGMGWDSTPGLYGTDFDEDYELSEKIGVGGAVTANILGTHTLSVESFFSDTTFLSNSLFTRPSINDSDTLRPGHARRTDGGAGNTDSLDNFDVVLQGGDIPHLAGVSYNLGWSRQKHSTSSEKNENAYVAGLTWEVPLTERIILVPMVEYAHVSNQGGADVTADYVTLAVGAELGFGWSAAAHATIRPVDDHDAGDDYTDHLAGFSIGYDLGARLKKIAPLLDGLGVEAGYKHERVARENLNTIGAVLTYERSF